MERVTESNFSSDRYADLVGRYVRCAEWWRTPRLGNLVEVVIYLAAQVPRPRATNRGALTCMSRYLRLTGQPIRSKPSSITIDSVPLFAIVGVVGVGES